MCGKCAGLGMKGKCPECGKEPAVKNAKIFYAATMEEIDPPDEFWSASMFWAENPNLEEDAKYQRYIKQLELLINKLKRGEGLDRSVIITAPAFSGKEIFAETCIYIAKSRGMITLPIIDLDEYNMLVTRNYRARGARDYKFTYDDLMEADLVFLSVPVIINRSTVASEIVDILRKRGRERKATVVLSRFSVTTLNMYDKNKSMDSFYLSNQSGNPFKLPAIISCI